MGSGSNCQVAFENEVGHLAFAVDFFPVAITLAAQNISGSPPFQAHGETTR